jgi:ketosteroid isomerase-like protein
MRRTGIGLALLAIVGTALAGCGGGDNSPAEQAAENYVDAYNGHDYERVCALLSDGYKADLLAGEGEEVEKIKCAEWFEEHTGGSATTLTLGDVEENGGQATADVHSQSEDTAGAENELALRLARQPNGTWKVVDLTTAAP